MDFGAPADPASHVALCYSLPLLYYLFANLRIIHTPLSNGPVFQNTHLPLELTSPPAGDSTGDDGAVAPVLSFEDLHVSGLPVVRLSALQIDIDEVREQRRSLVETAEAARNGDACLKTKLPEFPVVCLLRLLVVFVGVGTNDLRNLIFPYILLTSETCISTSRFVKPFGDLIDVVPGVTQE